MTTRVKRQAPVLVALTKNHPFVCRAILRGADKDLLHCLSECAHNILKGNVHLTPAEKSRLSKYKQQLRKVSQKKTSLKQKHKLVQTGGWVPLALAPLLKPLILPLAAGGVSGLAKRALSGIAKKAVTGLASHALKALKPKSKSRRRRR